MLAVPSLPCVRGRLAAAVSRTGSPSSPGAGKHPIKRQRLTDRADPSPTDPARPCARLRSRGQRCAEAVRALVDELPDGRDRRLPALRSSSASSGFPSRSFDAPTWSRQRVFRTPHRVAVPRRGRDRPGNRAGGASGHRAIGLDAPMTYRRDQAVLAHRVLDHAAAAICVAIVRTSGALGESPHTGGIRTGRRASRRWQRAVSPGQRRRSRTRPVRHQQRTQSEPALSGELVAKSLVARWWCAARGHFQAGHIPVLSPRASPRTSQTRRLRGFHDTATGDSKRVHRIVRFRSRARDSALQAGLRPIRRSDHLRLSPVFCAPDCPSTAPRIRSR